MSHYTVTVKLSAAQVAAHGNDRKETLEAVLAPFCEQDEKFFVFADEEDEWRAAFAKDAHGYSDFAKYADEWHGGECVDGRWGSTRNPNAKWDWWVVGGLWTGFYPLKPTARVRLGESGPFGNKPEKNRGDIVLVEDIDFAKIATEQNDAAERFFAEYQEMLGGKAFDGFRGPRGTALDLGVVRVERGAFTLGADEIAFPWSDKGVADDRRSWTDVAKKIDRETLFRDHLVSFNPIVTYAALDESGWHAPGNMGWFGCSSDGPNERLAFQSAFVDRFIVSAKPDDVLVVVDCHI